jgi:hypothetical protein
MKNISSQYQDLKEGKMTQAQFLRNARMMFPSFVTNHNSFDDSVKILKTKGMLVEGDAVKGTPDKEPTYDYPTQPGKYKKVVQEPEVDEQDGIYPATTLTDIPKEEVSKPIKSKTRPDGLEDIKNNDTKNEMKKVKVVKEDLDTYNTPPWDRPKYKSDLDDDDYDYDKEPFYPYQYLKQEYGSKARAIENNIYDASDEEDKDYWEEFMALESPKEADEFLERFIDKNLEENNRSFDDVFGDFIETDDATEIKAYLKTKGKEAIAKIKAKLPQLKDQARQKLIKLMKIKLDEMKTTQTPADTLSVTNLFNRIPMLKQKLNLINNAAELQDIFDYILDRVNPSLGASDTQLRTALNNAIQTNLDNKKAEKQAGTSSSDAIKNKLKPAITKLVQEVLDEMSQK